MTDILFNAKNLSKSFQLNGSTIPVFEKGHLFWRNHTRPT